MISATYARFARIVGSKKTKMNYILYKAENVENGWVYIGSTTSTIEERKKDHLQKAINGTGYEFQNDINTYGEEAFKWEQIDTAVSYNELAKKEKEYIIKYNSLENGYNADSGGGFKKTVYQYDIESGKLVNEYTCLDKASEIVKSTKQHISRACLSVNNIYKGFYWSYDYVESFIPKKDKRRKKVLYYDFEAEIVQEFKSVAEASKITGISKSCIARFCRGDRKPPSNVYWEYY